MSYGEGLMLSPSAELPQNFFCLTGFVRIGRSWNYRKLKYEKLNFIALVSHYCVEFLLI
jgi:hypothetical protein